MQCPLHPYILSILVCHMVHMCRPHCATAKLKQHHDSHVNINIEHTVCGERGTDQSMCCAQHADCSSNIYQELEHELYHPLDL